VIGPCQEVFLVASAQKYLSILTLLSVEILRAMPTARARIVNAAACDARLACGAAAPYSKASRWPIGRKV
jgi:hypothetical protein